MINQKYLTKQAKERGEAAMQDLPEKLFEVYSNTDPYEVYEMQDGSFSVRGATDADGWTFEDVKCDMEALREPLEDGTEWEA